jgi:hypothetical protein
MPGALAERAGVRPNFTHTLFLRLSSAWTSVPDEDLVGEFGAGIVVRFDCDLGKQWKIVGGSLEAFRDKIGVEGFAG